MKPGFSQGVTEPARVGVVILAGGVSARMGQPKQLLPYQGKTLIRRAAETALASICTRVVIVVGAHSELVKAELEDLPILLVHNEQWRDGMSSSIRVGLNALWSRMDIEAVVIMLCDQPFVSVRIINALVKSHLTTGKRIVAATYGPIRGVPALFSRELFSEILSLRANEGARQVIANHADEVAVVSFALGAVDVDTRQDYQRLSRYLIEDLR